jgi:hypothetical protein
VLRRWAFGSLVGFVVGFGYLPPGLAHVSCFLISRPLPNAGRGGNLLLVHFGAEVPLAEVGLRWTYQSGPSPIVADRVT